MKHTPQKLVSRLENKHVHIIGAGLLGASLGLALRAKNCQVTLADISPTALALAVDYGAGSVLDSNQQPDLIVVATPPEHTAVTIASALEQFPHAIVTDIASVKLQILEQLVAQGVNIDRYVGSHPMAGREKSGAIMARADLFVGRPWVICRDQHTAAAALQLVEAVALEVGAVPTEWNPADHDQAVAAVSHTPQVVASVLAAQLAQIRSEYLELAGGGLRDTTRIAASDPALWIQILEANSAAVARLLASVGNDLLEFTTALQDTTAPGAKTKIAKLLAAGNAGVARLPGKHGSAQKFAALQVIIADTPGQLAQLFSDLDQLRVNLEDIRLEHSPGAPIGFVEISVLPEVSETAAAGLAAKGWRVL